MKLLRKELLAAAAAVAMVAAAGGASAQVKMDAQGGAKAEAQGQTGGTRVQGQGGADTRTQTGPSGTQTQMDGSAKGGAQTQTQDGGAKARNQGGAETKQSGDAKKQRPSRAEREERKKERAAEKQERKQERAAEKQERKQQRDAQQREGGKAAGAADKPAQLSETQRTEISTTIRKQGNLRRVERSQINFNINVGTVVPRTVTLVPLPAPVIAVVPAYRGYLYIVVGDDMLIVHPRTYEIVAVIPA